MNELILTKVIRLNKQTEWIASCTDGEICRGTSRDDARRKAIAILGRPSKITTVRPK